MAVLPVKGKTARCRIHSSGLVVTFRPSNHRDLVPGEIVSVKPHKSWSYGGHPYLSGEIDSVWINAAALELVPLKLKEWGTWDPHNHYWAEEGETIEDWAKPIIARGARPSYKMEQVLPGGL